MTFGDSIQTCLLKYANFNDRATRSEFWWFQAAIMLGYAVISLLTTQDLHYAMDFDLGAGAFESNLHIASIAHNITDGLFSLAVLIPSLAVGARRLHDTNRTGWWQLLLFIPLIGWIVLVIFFATPSQEGKNQYGDQPVT